MVACRRQALIDDYDYHIDYSVVEALMSMTLRYDA